MVADNEHIGSTGLCDDHHIAQRVDVIIGIGTSVMFVLFQMYVLVPTALRRLNAIELLDQLSEDGWSEGTRSVRQQLTDLAPGEMAGRERD